MSSILISPAKIIALPLSIYYYTNMKDMTKIRSKIIKGRKLQLETKALRNRYETNPSPDLKEDIVSNTKKLQKLV